MENVNANLYTRLFPQFLFSSKHMACHVFAHAQTHEVSHDLTQRCLPEQLGKVT